jgi:hypothetical protein
MSAQAEDEKMVTEKQLEERDEDDPEPPLFQGTPPPPYAKDDPAHMNHEHAPPPSQSIKQEAESPSAEHSDLSELMGSATLETKQPKAAQPDQPNALPQLSDAVEQDLMYACSKLEETCRDLGKN